MVTFNKVVSDLCTACGVENDPTKRVTERRGIELIKECTEKVKVLTMGTAALTTVLEEHLDEEAATVDSKTNKAKVLPPVEAAAPVIKAPKLK